MLQLQILQASAAIVFALAIIFMLIGLVKVFRQYARHMTCTFWDFVVFIILSIALSGSAGVMVGVAVYFFKH